PYQDQGQGVKGRGGPIEVPEVEREEEVPARGARPDRPVEREAGGEVVLASPPADVGRQAQGEVPLPFALGELLVVPVEGDAETVVPGLVPVLVIEREHPPMALLPVRLDLEPPQGIEDRVGVL